MASITVNLLILGCKSFGIMKLSKCTGMSKLSSIDWSFCFEVTLNWLQIQNSIGAGVIVEIDETARAAKVYKGSQLSQVCLWWY